MMAMGRVFLLYRCCCRGEDGRCLEALCLSLLGGMEEETRLLLGMLLYIYGLCDVVNPEFI